MIASDGRLVIRIVKAAVVTVAVIFSVSFLFYARTSAQPQTSEQATVFRSSARVVLIDVLVTDKDGNPVHGLKPEDFTLTDEGKPQRLSAVEEHQQETKNEVQPPFALRPGAKTNWVSSPANGAVNIIVFDTLNTFAPDRAYGRQQLLKLLQNLPQGQQVALFTLSTRLYMVQDFTAKSDVLIAAAKRINTSGHLSAAAPPETQPGTEATGDQSASVNQPTNANQPTSATQRTTPSQDMNGNTVMNPGQPVSETQQLDGAIEAAANNLGTTRTANDMYVAMMDIRVAYTLDALRDLAKVTASLPGRKNVIWLTTGFPLKLDGTMMIGGRISPVLREREYSKNLREASAALASSQIAIYPVDLRGLVSGGDVSVVPTALLDPFKNFDERDTMQVMAEQTGGRAYYDKNDLDFGIKQVLTKESNYYTLAYSPRNIKWDGTYHNVNVKLARKGLELTYRRGYHAIGEKPLTDEQASRNLGDALNLDTMDSRMVVLASQVMQPEAPGQPVKIRCFIDPNTLVLDDTAEGTRNAAIAIGATAWDEQKKKAATVATKVTPVLKPEDMAKFKTTGIPWTLEMPVAPGRYALKLAVVDLKSGKAGSMTVQLKVDVPQKGAAAGN